MLNCWVLFSLLGLGHGKVNRFSFLDCAGALSGVLVFFPGDTAPVIFRLDLGSDGSLLSWISGLPWLYHS